MTEKVEKGSNSPPFTDDCQSKPERIAQVGILGGCFLGCAFTTAVCILVGCWVVKVLWKAAFG